MGEVSKTSGKPIPKWPDFLLDGATFRGKTTWVARTDTGRPGTPVFSLMLWPSWSLTEEDAYAHARIELDQRFAKAHPNGCPGR